MSEEVQAVQEFGDLAEVKFMETTEVAPLFRVHAQTIRVWCREGKFPNYIKAGSKFLIPYSDVRALIHDTYQSESEAVAQ